MRLYLLGVALLACAVCGCAGGNSNRPCGPGYLGNMLVPQQSWGADYRPACYTHDACYAAPCADRAACDAQFLEDMNAACQCANYPALCRLRAKRWYWQVRVHGGPSFRQAQRQGGGKKGIAPEGDGIPATQSVP